MKTFYQAPLIEVIEIEIEDAILGTSGNTEDYKGGNDLGGGDSSDSIWG